LDYSVTRFIRRGGHDSGLKPHVITSMFEHESILEPLQYLEGQGKIEVSYIKPSRDGYVEPQDVQAALKENTVLVSIIYVNNEIGTVQPIKEIGKIIEKFRTRNEKQNSKFQILDSKFPLFHTDAVQAIQFFEPRLDYLKVDAMTVSSHKVYGPKGTGVLIARKHVPLEPLLRGGGQELEKRSGTSHVAGFTGFARAVELIEALGFRDKEIGRIKNLKEKLKEGIVKAVPKATIVAGGKDCAPHILSVIFPGIEAQVMLIALDQEGIAVSSGSACSVKSIKPSHVLLSLGYQPKDALSSIRFSLGRYTTKTEIDKTLDVVTTIVKRFRK
jgi:cysteine desulfurase